MAIISRHLRHVATQCIYGSHLGLSRQVQVGAYYGFYMFLSFVLMVHHLDLFKYIAAGKMSWAVSTRTSSNDVCSTTGSLRSTTKPRSRKRPSVLLVWVPKGTLNNGHWRPIYFWNCLPSRNCISWQERSLHFSLRREPRWKDHSPNILIILYCVCSCWPILAHFDYQKETKQHETTKVETILNIWTD